MARSKKSAPGSKAAKPAKRVVAAVASEGEFGDTEIGCMLDADHCPIKSRGHECDGTTEVHACSHSNCKRGKKLNTCNEMQKLMLGTGLYKLMGVCIAHRARSRKSMQQPERAERNRRNMHKNVNPRNNPHNNKKPRDKGAVRAYKFAQDIRKLE